MAAVLTLSGQPAMCKTCHCICCCRSLLEKPFREAPAPLHITQPQVNSNFELPVASESEQ
jgi:hypothetical protein